MEVSNKRPVFHRCRQYLAKLAIRKNRRNIRKVFGKSRKFLIFFEIFSKIMLDKWLRGWYYNEARVGEICEFPRIRKTRIAMMREIARRRGNFRGVCPVIGRLNCF